MTHTITPSDPTLFCSQASQQAGEQIFGTTAGETTVWLVLEYPYAWGAQALPESALADPVKQQLERWVRDIPGARLQLIKHQSSPSTTPALVSSIPGQPISFFVALAGEQKSVTYRFVLDSYDELCSLDVPDLVNSARAEHYAENGYTKFIHEEPLFLVCTNGRRDQCCAKWGLPVYQAMHRYAGDAVWQTTHTGGHRFAATMICLPQGIGYGWLTPQDVEPLVDAHRRGELYRLDRYRGRSCYNRTVQAAEYFVRQQTGSTALDAWRFADSEALSDNCWLVAFESRQRDQRHRLHIERRVAELPLVQSCGKAGEHVPQYFLQEYETHTLAAVGTSVQS